LTARHKKELALFMRLDSWPDPARSSCKSPAQAFPQPFAEFFQVPRVSMSVLGGPGIENLQTESPTDRTRFNPTRWAHFAWGLCSNLPTQIRILHTFSKPPFLRLLLGDPARPFSFLNRNYLARQLTVAQRAHSLLHHYKRIHASLPNQTLRQILASGLIVYETCRDASLFRVTLDLTGTIYWEGELSLHLEVNGVAVCILSFSIVPGSVAGALANEVLLVACVQSAKGCESQIRLATKSMLDVAPPALLVAALQGVAAALGIHAMAGTCATIQSSYLQEHCSLFQDAYDNFFATLGATKNSAGFFCSPLPLEEKPLPLIPKGHKIRVRKKREFKRQVAESVAQSLLKIG
jgi:uncharacterized protein VirK/YbjX